MASNGVITIRFEQVGQQPGPQPIDPSRPTKESEKATSANILETAVMSTLLKKAASQAKGIIIDEALYQQQKYYKLNDDYLGQQNMSIALNVINKVWDTGVSIVAGAKIGAAAGPVGAVIGATIAALTSGINLGRQIYHNYEQENINLARMNSQLRFNRERAGYSLTAGSRGENR